MSIGLVMLSIVAITGCEGSAEAPPPTLRVELSPCIGPSAGAEGLASQCRGRLSDMASPTGPHACFVVTRSDIGGAPTLRLGLQWVGDQLEPMEGDRLDVPPASELRAALFFLSGGPGAADPCSPFDLETACQSRPDCALKLGPDTQQTLANGVTRFDFFDDDDGRCTAESGLDGNAMRFDEQCDGADNDCDGLIDEARREICSVGVGVCQARGDESECRNGQYVCNAPLISPAPSDVMCDMLDEDCDGRVDEDADCEQCLFDNECLPFPNLPQCVDGQCRQCDPADGAGCPPEAPLCDARSFTCGACMGDDDCGPGRRCVNSRCGDCSPADPGSCPDAQRPVCDLDDLTCRSCQSGNECPTGYCFNGRCATCQPVTNNGCDGATPVCDSNSQTCRACQQNAECALIDPATPVCSAGVCVSCNVDDNTGCTDPTAPICADDGVGPRCGPCVADGECSTGTCRAGRCIGCNPDTNQGCNDAQPVCDDSNPAEPFCRACQASVECSQPGRRVCTGGRCEECDDVSQDGCAIDGAEPICAGSQCRACIADGECTTRDGDLDYCVAGRCRICTPESNIGCRANTPVCDAQAVTCRGCRGDQECAGQQCLGTGRCSLCDPADNAGCPANAPICVDGGDRCRGCNNDGECGPGRICTGDRCVECEPGSNRGCDGGSVAPICDAQTASCRDCRNDGECGRDQCLRDGRCAECDPTNGDGCDVGSNAPLCGQNGQCRGCQADADCTENGLGNLCRDGQCALCEAGTNLGCGEAAPICENGNQCRRCFGNDECGEGRFCSNGSCTGCVPGTTTGCDENSDAPFCDAINTMCRGCRQNNECFQLNRDYCIEGACLACDPGTGAGCDGESDRPICSPAGECVPCANDEQCGAQVGVGVQCSDGRCGACDPNDPGTCPANLPVCNPVSLTCGPCVADESCLLGNCVAGSCVTCANNDDCEAGGDRPYCDPATQRCRPCAGDNDCAGNTNGLECRDGRCGCSVGDFESCIEGSRQPICDRGADTCRGCNGDGECTGHPRGDQCTASRRCRLCDPDDPRNRMGDTVYEGCSRDEGICFPPGDICGEECDPDEPDCPDGQTCESNGNGHFGCR